MSTAVHSPGQDPGMGCSPLRTLHLSVDQSPGHLFTLSVPGILRARLTPIHGRRFTVHAPTSCVRAVDLFNYAPQNRLPNSAEGRVSTDFPVNGELSISKNSKRQLCRSSFWHPLPLRSDFFGVINWISTSNNLALCGHVHDCESNKLWRSGRFRHMHMR
jgi:hypothetical protein